MKVQLLMTGDELLSGDIIDSNAAMIAKYLKELGLTVNKKTTLGDKLTELTEELRHASRHADIIVVNGGLGPTVDDLTAQALADAASVPVTLHTDAEKHLQQWAERRNLVLSDANMKQAYLPQGCDILDNPVGSAVGFSVTLNNCHIICTPGVPSELDAMLSSSVNDVLNVITKSLQKPLLKRLYVFGIGESNLQQKISDNFADWPKEITLGFRASFPTLEVKLFANDPAHADLLDIWTQRLTDFLGDHIFAKNVSTPPTLASIVQGLLIEKGLKITTAESCTGGLISSLITAEAGSSQVFEAGYITYSNEVKQQLVGVKVEALETHGAVSEQVVLQMARGALHAAKADIAIAVSGVAGPAGGSAEKPVGTVWIAWGDKNNCQTHKFLIKGNRHYIQQATAYRALDLVRRYLLESEQLPEYL